MMAILTNEIDTYFGIDSSSDVGKTVSFQIDHDDDVLEKLIAMRQRDFDEKLFAIKIGVKLEALQNFEEDPIDANLDMIRIYCAGLDVRIIHTIAEPATRRLASESSSAIQLLLNELTLSTTLKTRSRRRPVKPSRKLLSKLNERAAR